ncbi:hypothetical protein ACP5WA_11580 [Thomasclavelia ramosa]
MEFKTGDLVAYCPKDGDGNIYKVEVGIFKKYNSSRTGGFVFYHFGDTAACTSLEDLYPVKNDWLVLGVKFKEDIYHE